MTKNIAIMCDGTGNEIKANLSNVLKLFRVAVKNNEQVVYYNPGVGTLSEANPWTRFRDKFALVLGLATGFGLDRNVSDAYRFLVENYVEGDRVYLFGFSRGAYTVRVLAGFIYLVGLLKPSQLNLVGYAFTAYKQAAEANDLDIASRFKQITRSRTVPIHFVGVWDTVSTVIVPRPDRFYIPSRQELPYTKQNPGVRIFRHACSIDERRCMFRLNHWRDGQKYRPNRFNKRQPPDQDSKQVWFAGVHSDIGGGYPEDESGLAKFPLEWMIAEAAAHGLRVQTAMVNHLVRGEPRKGGTRQYVRPNATAKLHNSLTGFWRLLEWIPKPLRYREWSPRRNLGGFYLPRAEPRLIDERSHIHHSVYQRYDKCPSYRPKNLPPREAVQIEGTLDEPQPL